MLLRIPATKAAAKMMRAAWERPHQLLTQAMMKMMSHQQGLGARSGSLEHQGVLVQLVLDAQVQMQERW